MPCLPLHREPTSFNINLHKTFKIKCAGAGAEICFLIWKNEQSIFLKAGSQVKNMKKKQEENKAIMLSLSLESDKDLDIRIRKF